MLKLTITGEGASTLDYRYSYDPLNDSPLPQFPDYLNHGHRPYPSEAVHCFTLVIVTFIGRYEFHALIFPCGLVRTVVAGWGDLGTTPPQTAPYYGFDAGGFSFYHPALGQSAPINGPPDNWVNSESDSEPSAEPYR